MARDVARCIKDDKFPILMFGVDHLVHDPKVERAVSKHSVNLAERWNGVSILSWLLASDIERRGRVPVVKKHIGTLATKNIALSLAKKGKSAEAVGYESNIYAVRTNVHHKLLGNPESLAQRRERERSSLESC